jgi:branched-chain amino acid transport system substrate-binding protein
VTDRATKFRQAAIVYLHVGILYEAAAYVMWRQGMLPEGRGPAWIWLVFGAAFAILIALALWRYHRPWVALTVWAIHALRLPAVIKGAFFVPAGTAEIAAGFYVTALVALYSLAAQRPRRFAFAMAALVAACGEAEDEAAPAEEPADPDVEDPADPEDEEEAPPADEPEGDPIVIGGTLSQTGFLAPTALIHDIVAAEFIEWLNEEGGLLGRPVEWIVLDDESEPEQAAALYERLITEENVDLVMGPYGTANITSAMAVAERYGYVYPHHTASLTYAYTYDKHFPTWFVGLNTHYTTPAKVFEAYETLDDPPETVGFVVNRFPGTDFLVFGVEEASVPSGGVIDPAGGAAEVAGDMGLDVVLELSFDIGTTDFMPIASRIAEADPDLLYVGALGEDGPNLMAALEQIDYQPRNHFYQWPAPGPMLAAGALAEGATSVTIFEPFEPYLSHEGGDVLVERYREEAAERGLSYTDPETQAGASWAAWQVLVAGVEGCQCLDHDEIADYILNNTIETVQGDFNYRADQQNYGDDIQTIKQIQDGGWYVVWPDEFASEDRSLEGPLR